MPKNLSSEELMKLLTLRRQNLQDVKMIILASWPKLKLYKETWMVNWLTNQICNAKLKMRMLEIEI
jgi:hypothetical protein